MGGIRILRYLSKINFHVSESKGLIGFPVRFFDMKKTTQKMGGLFFSE